MRPITLSNLKMGINRLRTKGGASPSSLYDLQNAWVTSDGSINPREGTNRFAQLTSATKGLMADDGIFNVFSITPITVPAGFQDNVLVNPNDATQTIVKIWFAKPFMGFPYVVAEFANGDVFHYWLQSSGTWASNTVYTNSTLILPTAPTGFAYLAQRVSAVNPTWAPETVTALNAIVEPTEYTGYMYKAVAVAGAAPHTGETEPVWPIVSAGTIQEFGDFDTSSTDAGTTQGTTASTAQPLSTTITDRYGDSSTIASSGTSAGGTGTLPTVASTKVTVWTKGTLYAPGAVVQPTTAQGGFINAIPNGDFENGDDGSWILSTGAAYVAGGTHPYQGNECLSFTAAGTNETATMASFGVVTPGQSVTATAYVNPNNSGANLGMGITLRWYTASDTFISNINSTVQENGGYRLVSVTGVAPPGAAHVRVQLFGGNGTSAHTGYADLVSWNLATPAAVSNFLFEAVQPVSATSAATEPTWPTIAGNTVIDGGVTWKAIGTSIITWEAIPIMQSGTSEPVWPTAVPIAVLDVSTFTDVNGVVIKTSISWITSSRQVTDAKDPNTKVVALAASHVFAGDKDIVPFSAAVDPTDWSSANNAGYLPTGLNNYGDNPVAVLALYRSNLMAMNAGGYQMWQVDPDPANMALLDAQPVGSIYTQAAQSVANDLLFLTEVGVRNLGTAGANANMQIGNLGQPVDPLVKALLPVGPNPFGDPYFSEVGLLLPMTGVNGATVFPDISTNNNIAVPHGSVAVNVTTSPFGGGSAYFNGVTDYITVPIVTGGPIDIGLGDFTIEFWVFTNNIVQFACPLSIMEAGQPSPIQIILGQAGSGTLSCPTCFNSGTGAGTSNMVQNQWNLITLCVSGTDGFLFMNGAGLGGDHSLFFGVSARAALINGQIAIGAALAGNGAPSDFFQGFISNVRITKGIARYVAVPFALPTTAFPAYTKYNPISLYYPGRGQYWLIFGPQVLVLTINGTGLKTWSRYVFPEVITDWALNQGDLYLRTATDKVWVLDDQALQDDVGGTPVNFQSWMQWPYLDSSLLGYNTMMIGFDLVGTGSVDVRIAYREDDATTFIDNPGFSTTLNVTPAYTITIADILPGTPVPIPVAAPSYSLILLWASNQKWQWQASNLYVQNMQGAGQTS